MNASDARSVVRRHVRPPLLVHGDRDPAVVARRAPQRPRLAPPTHTGIGAWTGSGASVTSSTVSDGPAWRTVSPASSGRSDRQHLVGQRGALAQVHGLARLAVLVRGAAEPHPQHHAPAGQPVDRREPVRERQRPLPRHHRDVRPDQQPLGRERAGRDQRPRVAGRHPPDEREVVPDEERLPARVLRDPREVRDAARLGEVAEVDQRQPEPERLRPGRPPPMSRCPPASPGARPARRTRYLRFFLRSAMTSRAAFRPGAAVTPPPGCAPEPARYSPSTGIR